MSSGTPYIGSKISLVSKAEIRYEGFLYTIDQNDSTVTLAKVISLGTEDRVPGAGAVPAREEVFEYIVFRGSDIKDLHVCEGPKKVEDPAIVTHSYSQSYNPNYHRGPPPFPNQGGPGLGFGYNPFNLPQQNNVPVDMGQHPNNRQPSPPNQPRDQQRGSGPNKNSGSNFQDNRNKMKGNDGGSSKYRDDGYSRENRESTGSKQGKDKETRRDDGGNRDGARDERGTRDNRSYRDNRDNRSRGGRADRGENDRREHQRNNRGEDSDDKDSGRGTRDNRYRENRREVRDNRNTRDNRDNRDNYRDNRDNRDNRLKRDNREQEDHDEQRSAGSESNRGQSRGGRGIGRGGRGGGGNRRGGGPRGGGGGGGNQGNGGVAPATRNKFTEDFDFETSNAKFNKEEIEKELLKVLKKVKIKDEDGSEEIKDIEGERESDERAPLPSPDKFYDRSKSFFDNILCEAMPPRNEEEVMTRRQEQALNTETFGSSAAHYRPAYRGRGRGRGRWRGGRGFHRGRGNFRGNSNRRWVDYEFDYEAAGIKSKNQPKVSED